MRVVTISRRMPVRQEKRRGNDKLMKMRRLHELYRRPSSRMPFRQLLVNVAHPTGFVPHPHGHHRGTNAAPWNEFAKNAVKPRLRKGLIRSIPPLPGVMERIA